jgi:hypothetical protein
VEMTIWGEVVTPRVELAILVAMVARVALSALVALSASVALPAVCLAREVRRAELLPVEQRPGAPGEGVATQAELEAPRARWAVAERRALPGTGRVDRSRRARAVRVSGQTSPRTRHLHGRGQSWRAPSP